MKEKKTHKRSKYVSTAIISALVIGILFGYTSGLFTSFKIVPDENGRGWHIVFEGNLAQAAEGDPGAGASGILEIFFVNHSATHTYTNTSSTIEGWCDANNLGYANADDFNVELAHSVDFDIVIKVRVNQTHAHNGTIFMDSWVRMNLTSADLGIGADTGMDKFVATNDSGKEYIWLYFWYDFSDAGYNLSKDESADITSIKLQAYY